jgi:hypothetical protein
VLLFRVFPYLASAKVGEPGHPLYVHPDQGHGRWDNPRHYLARYMAGEPSAAAGEAFAHLSQWDEAMFPFPHIPGARRALGTYELPDDLPYVDLDDASTLVRYGMRPSQVVQRNRPYTQGKALAIYQQKHWKGLRCWSFHRPEWRVWCLWDVDPACVDVDDLTTSHPVVRDAATALRRPRARRSRSPRRP